jgi:hypothetical protein
MNGLQGTWLYKTEMDSLTLWGRCITGVRMEELVLEIICFQEANTKVFLWLKSKHMFHYYETQCLLHMQAIWKENESDYRSNMCVFILKNCRINERLNQDYDINLLISNLMIFLIYYHNFLHYCWIYPYITVLISWQLKAYVLFQFNFKTFLRYKSFSSYAFYFFLD